MIDNNLTSIILSALALVGTIVTAVLGYLTRKGVAEVKDGMQTKMIEAKQGEAAAVSHAEGLAAGELKEQARAAPPTPTS